MSTPAKKSHKHSSTNNNGKALSPADYFRLFLGKVRRFYYFTINRSYLKRSLERRRGECVRCGACCRLGHTCLFLRFDSNNLAYCTNYSKRPPNCRIFPIDEQDLKDRKLLSDKPCGYYFLENKSQKF